MYLNDQLVHQHGGETHERIFKNEPVTEAQILRTKHYISLMLVDMFIYTHDRMGAILVWKHLHFGHS